MNKLKLVLIILFIAIPAYAFGVNTYSYSVYSSDSDQYNDRRYFIPNAIDAVKDDEGTDFIISYRNPLQEVFTGKINKNEPIYDDGSTLLMQAAYLNDIAVVEKLLDTGADPNVENLKQGNMTALMIAATMNHSAIVKLLVKHKANLNQVTISGMSPLLMACHKRYFELAQELIDLGANVNQISINQVHRNHVYARKITPLMLMTSRGNDDAVSFLIKNHANLDLITEEYGETALMIATAHRHCNIIKILIDAGADRNIKNKLGLKAEDYFRLKIGIKNNNCIELFGAAHDLVVR